MMFVVFSGQEVAGGDSVIEARTVRDCNVHGDAWVRIRKQLVGGDCHRLLCELAEQEESGSDDAPVVR